MNPATFTDTLVRTGGLRDVASDPIGYSSQLASDLAVFMNQVFYFILKCVAAIIDNPFLLLISGITLLGITISIFGLLLRRD